MRVLIVGCGYVGLPLGAELVRLGHEVFGLRRSANSDGELKSTGLTPLHADITKAETLLPLPTNFDWVVNCVSSSHGDVEDYRRVYLQGTRNLIEWLAPVSTLRMAGNLAPSPPPKEERAGERRPSVSSSNPLTPTLPMNQPTPNPSQEGSKATDARPQFPSWEGLGVGSEGTFVSLGRGEGVDLLPLKKFVYTSSSGVYGQTDGSVVKETSPSEPATDTAKVLVETEKLLMAAATERKFPAVILRVAGIYGPDRGHLLKQYLKDEARIEGKGARIMNMIHRDDLIGVIIAALKSGRPGEIYNAVDDEPVSQLTFFTWLAGTLGKDPPPSVPEDLDAARKRGVTNKKVSNRKLKMELGYQFKYPNFRKGYTAELIRLERLPE